MLEKFYNISTIYGIFGAIVTILALIIPSQVILQFATIYDTIGISILIWELIRPSITMKFTITYDNFNDLQKTLKKFEKRLPPFTPEENINFTLSIKENKYLILHTEKRSTKLDYPLSWEGPEIVAKKSGYNTIIAKIMLNFEQSTAENGNIYLSGTSRLGRFHYLIGIDKKSRDIFFHIWDKKEKIRYKGSPIGFYPERGRTHLKDYFKENGEKWIIIGIEWGFDGPKYFAYKEGEKDIVKIPVNISPKIKTEILKDSRNIYLYGVKEFAIRTDLEVKENKYKTIIGAIDYIKVKPAPLNWIPTLKNLLKIKTKTSPNT